MRGSRASAFPVPQPPLRLRDHSSQTVEPLPFHGMSRYPYPEGERFPEDGVYRPYREHYNTRPALRLLRPPGEAERTHDR